MKNTITILLLLFVSTSYAQFTPEEMAKIKEKGLSGGVKNAPKLNSSAMVKTMKGTINFTNYDGKKFTLKCGVGVGDFKSMLNDPNVKDKISEKKIEQMKKSGKEGIITITAGDESGDNFVQIAGMYKSSEKNGDSYFVEEEVGLVTMYNTHQLPPFNDKGGELKVEKKGGKWVFSGSTLYKSPKGGILIVFFEGSAPVTSSNLSTKPAKETKGPKRLTKEEMAIEMEKAKNKK